MEPVETAGDLYREIRRRGLELRNGNGRDDALLEELIIRLNCPDHQLQAFLDRSALTAEDFLLAFLRLAQPFANMFEQIWEFLVTYCAPMAEETIAIRFGFPDAAAKSTVDLDQFRRYVDAEERILASVRTQIWPPEALGGLFAVGDELLRRQGGDFDMRDNVRPYDMHGRYVPGEPYRLPTLTASDHPFDRIAGEVGEVFQAIIDGFAAEMRLGTHARALPEVDEGRNAERGDSLRDSAWMLTDLLPVWFGILSRYSEVGGARKDAALSQYDASIRELLGQREAVARIPIREALDILDMPFWRHRWHTYEVWATVRTLQSLAAYKPRPRIEDGRVLLDGYATEVIADLAAIGHPSACVAIQVATPFALAKRRAIKPDLRICFDTSMSADGTAGVVEFKQRSGIDPRNLTEVATAYSSGCPHSGGVVILNYDDTQTSVALPEGCSFLEGVQPLNHDALQEFDAALGQMLLRANLLPARSAIVLLDVSTSMADSYKDKTVQEALSSVLATPWVRVLRFSNGLEPGGDLSAELAGVIKTSGGTELGKALMEIEAAFGLPERLLILTDGAHDHPAGLLSRTPRVRECRPSELAANISWLTE